MAVSDNIAFVLVRPLQAGNIGAAARALKNMGFHDLRLVGPPARGRNAAMMAVHGRDVLESASTHRELKPALADATVVVGTTCRPGLYRSGAVALREAAAELGRLAEKNRIAILFGPEDTGLTNRELKLCQRLITIPTAAEYSSLNLAQALMLVAYELRLALDPTPVSADGEGFAPSLEVDAMLERMAEALVAIGFLPKDNPEHIMYAVRAMLGRSGVARRELDILNGIASQVRWVAEGGAETLDAKKRAGKRLR